MVTCGRCQAKLRVRIPALHPIFVLLAFFFLSGSAGAADELDHYAAAPDTLVSSVSSSDSLARVVGGDIFGIYWSTFGGNGQITAIDGVSMRDRADGVQELATATYSTFKGVERAIAAASEGSEYLPLIYGTLQQQGDMGTVYTRLLEVLDQLSGLKTALPGGDVLSYDFGWAGFTYNRTGSLLQLLSDLNRAFYFAFYDPDVLHLNPDGIPRASSQSGRNTLTSLMSEGFLGLSNLLFPSAGVDIYGLDYTGQDKTSTRSGWSLADISANGFSGLGYLLGGPSYEGERRHGVWTWVDPTDPTNVRQYEPDNLFELFWELGWIQNSLAKLEYVYASDDDIQFKQDEKPNMDAVKDSFFGDGEAAVKPSDIQDAAGLTSGAKGTFGGAGDAADVFVVLQSDDAFSFFSQQVSDELDKVGSLAVQSDDDFMDGFVTDDDEFYYVQSDIWDVTSFLEGLSK